MKKPIHFEYEPEGECYKTTAWFVYDISQSWDMEDFQVEVCIHDKWHALEVDRATEISLRTELRDEFAEDRYWVESE